MSRDRTDDGRWTTRAVLALGLAGGLLVPIYFLFVDSQTPLGWDFQAYVYAAKAALRGHDFVGLRPLQYVGQEPGIGHGVYTYPPFVLLFFLPYGLLPGWGAAFAVQSAINLGAGLFLGHLCVRTVEHYRGPLSRIDRWLVGSYAVCSTYAVAILGLGQVDLLIGIALAVGFLALERDMEVVSGVSFGAAAVFKLFPALIGVWLLHRRAWKAIATAVATGVGSIVVGVLAFGPATTVRFVEFVLFERSRLKYFEDGMSADFFAMGAVRPLSYLLPDVDPNLFVPIAAAVFFPLLGALYLHTRTPTDRLVAFLATMIVVLVVSPASNVTHAVLLYFPLVPLLYVVEHPRSRALLLAGTAVMSIPIQPGMVRDALAALAAPPSVQAAAVGVVEPVLTAGTVTLYGLLVVLLGCVSYLVRSRPEGRPTGRPAGGD